MIHQIKAQLNASLEKIQTQTDIEKLCSKLSATLSMAFALDKAVGTVNELEDPSFYNKLYVYVEDEIDGIISMIQEYEKKEEPTE